MVYNLFKKKWLNKKIEKNAKRVKTVSESRCDTVFSPFSFRLKTEQLRPIRSPENHSETTAMGIAEASPVTMAPLLLRNLLTSLFGFADKFLINLSKKHKLLEVIHCLSVSFFHFFLRWLPSLFPSIHQVSDDRYPLKPPKGGSYGTSGSGSGSGDLGVSRALTQLLSIISHVQVSSRKYEVVRSLAEKLIDENQREGIEELREVNRAVLSTAFDRTISQIEAAMLHQGFHNDDDEDEDGETSSGPVEFWLARVVRAVCSRLGSVNDGANRTGSSAEKLAAELLWLAEKMASCGCGIEACQRWASAAQLGRLSLSAEPRLQGSLVRVAGTRDFFLSLFSYFILILDIFFLILDFFFLNLILDL